MGSLDVGAILVVLAVAFSYLEHRFLRLPAAMGFMALALALSLGDRLPSRHGGGPFRALRDASEDPHLASRRNGTAPPEADSALHPSVAVRLSSVATST